MRLITLVPAVLALGATAAAQDVRRTPRPETRAFSLFTSDETPRAVIGVGTSGGVSNRDTLGLLINSVTPSSPADRAGLQEGDRLQSINGTNLRIARADIDDPDMRGIMQRRLQRALEKVKPGEEVNLRVYSGGQTRDVRVKTVESDSLYRNEWTSRGSGSGRGFGFAFGRNDEDRPSLGISIGATGSRRDTLGVFVFSVNDSGPAARAGIEEGDRIASINGVDVRVNAADAGDAMVGGMRARRLQRELSRVKPGDDVTLRVYTDGKVREVKVKTVRASDLPHHDGSFMITGDRLDGMIPPIPPIPPIPALPMRALEDVPMRALEMIPRVNFRFDSERLTDRIQRELDRAFDGIQRAQMRVRTSSHS